MDPHGADEHSERWLRKPRSLDQRRNRIPDRLAAFARSEMIDGKADGVDQPEAVALELTEYVGLARRTQSAGIESVLGECDASEQVVVSRQLIAVEEAAIAGRRVGH